MNRAKGPRTHALLALAASVLSVGCSGSEPSRSVNNAPPPAAHDSSARRVPAARPVPPYHDSAEAAKPFPRLLSAEYFRDYPVVARAYRIASRIPGVIAQQPCYCYCDKFGHRSLLDCYASDHGAG